jgi:hypothetical protein
MFSSSDNDKFEDDDVCRTCLQGGHLQLENNILSRKIRRSSFRMAGCVGNSQPEEEYCERRMEEAWEYWVVMAVLQMLAACVCRNEWRYFDVCERGSKEEGGR